MRKEKEERTINSVRQWCFFYDKVLLYCVDVSRDVAPRG